MLCVGVLFSLITYNCYDLLNTFKFWVWYLWLFILLFDCIYLTVFGWVALLHGGECLWMAVLWLLILLRFGLVFVVFTVGLFALVLFVFFAV